jgi:hypothetical protein
MIRVSIPKDQSDGNVIPGLINPVSDQKSKQLWLLQAHPSRTTLSLLLLPGTSVPYNLIASRHIRPVRCLTNWLQLLLGTSVPYNLVASGHIRPIQRSTNRSLHPSEHVFLLPVHLSGYDKVPFPQHVRLGQQRQTIVLRQRTRS